ncbi:MAG: hypothetical protein QGH45_00785 [Myxococcota bacterium]|nr:hypothetical protein [Myxococcota bacterium]
MRILLYGGILLISAALLPGCPGDEPTDPDAPAADLTATATG